jgi:RHS repeat-associated protein
VNLSSSTPTYLTYTPSDSSWLATNNAGQQVAFWRYDAFGNLATGTPDSPFGYSGQYTDASTGLVNDRARFYESQTGSFTTRDPAFSSTDQAYQYASGDPINRGDPGGLCVKVLWVCVGGGQETASIGFHFDPGAAANATVNIGRGASFGLSDRIANLISPGASCTVEQNAIDQVIGAGAITVATLGAGSVAESNVTLYRAVSLSERSDIDLFGGFRAGPNSYEGKLFATSADDAARFGRIIDALTPGGEPFHVVATEIPSSLANSFEFFTTDGMQAVHVAGEQLGSLNSAGSLSILTYVPWVAKP